MMERLRGKNLQEVWPALEVVEDLIITDNNVCSSQYLQHVLCFAKQRLCSACQLQRTPSWPLNRRKINHDRATTGTHLKCRNRISSRRSPQSPQLKWKETKLPFYINKINAYDKKAQFPLRAFLKALVGIK